MKNIVQVVIPKEDYSVTFRSNFDSGNMSKVELGINNSFLISPEYDCFDQGHQNHIGWYYFAVKGIPPLKKHKFVIKKMYQLWNQSKFSEYFKPVYMYEGADWNRIQMAMSFTKEDDTQLHFEFTQQKKGEVFFAYSYPFTFEQSQKTLKHLLSEHKHSKSIYYHDETLIKSHEGRPLHLLTISSQQSRLIERQPLIHQSLFLGNAKNRSFQFEHHKRVIIITARVHPAEVPASHALNGILNFITSKDARAYLLRKHFVFKIVPMLNPDGVYNGYYRMDSLNQNLNRYYSNPDVFRQPSAFAVRHLGQYYRKEGTLCFYLDLHAHHQRKGSFIYGNAFQNLLDQVQTKLYPKLLSLNSIDFDYGNSSFAKKQMNSKDKKDLLTKQGCGRVIFTKVLGQIYSYTLEVGYTMSGCLNPLSPITNAHRKHEKYGIILEDIENVKSTYYSSQKNVYFCPISYENLGKCCVLSILDLFQLNPFSRLFSTPFQNLPALRKEIQSQILKNESNFQIYAKKQENGRKTETQKRVQKTIQNKQKNTRNQSNLKYVLATKIFQIRPNQGKLRHLSLVKNRITK